jgi:DNA-binding CsgD family transcriptional regulator
LIIDRTALRAGDLARAREAIDVTLRPSDFERVDEWRRAVIDAVKALVGADRGGFMITTSGGADWLSDFPRVRLLDYGVRIESVVPELDIWRRHLDLGVHTRNEVWLPIRPDFYETAYFRDFLRPLRAFNSLGMTWKRRGLSVTQGLCQILVHQDTESPTAFGPRERALLDLVGPAVEAGTEQALSTGGDVESTLDALTTPVLLMSPDGRTLHANPAARDILRGSERVEEVVMDAARSAALADSRRDASTERVRRVVRVEGLVLELTLGRFSLGTERGTGRVVTLQMVRGQPSRETRMRAARDQGLTPRQAEVAVLMSERLASKEIAAELGISPNTVRRHEEVVLRRLGVRRRTEVSEALSSELPRE